MDSSNSNNTNPPLNTNSITESDTDITNNPNINILPNDSDEESINNENEIYENTDDYNEEENYEGFMPQFPNLFSPSPLRYTLPLGFPFGFSSGISSGISFGIPNSHILSNLNNAQGIFDMMSNIMIPMGVSPNILNINNSTNLIINEINPANSGNSVLPNIAGIGQPININGTNFGTQQMIDEEVNKLILSGTNNLGLVTTPVLSFIENCYLENVQYDVDVVNIIRYTIKNCFSRRTDFEASELISGIIYYSLAGNNSLFSDNYDHIVLPMLHNELKRIVTQSIRLAILRRAIGPPTMEDVKLVIKPDVLEQIPKSKYSELDDKIKSMNVSCTICQDEFNKEDIVRILPCEHIYHPDCIDDWLKEHSYKCPCCRKPAAEHSAKI